MGDAAIARPLDRQHNGRCARLNEEGYVLVYEPTDPRAYNGGWYLEHRLMVEAAIGRTLEPWEVVHHRNEIKDDNRFENFEVQNALDHAVLSLNNHRADIDDRLRRLDEYERKFGPLEDYERPPLKES